MKELDKLTTRSRTGTCLPTSSACVKWEGPTIPCLTICKGESIEQVVVELASIVCTTKDSIDISTLNFGCLVPNGQNNPTTIKQLLQLLITKSCQSSTVDPGSGGGDVNLPVIDLPACLQYQDNTGNIITSLGLDEYSEYLATSMCDMIDDIASINQQIISINTQLNGVSTGGGSSSGGGSVNLTITSKCLSSTAPGATTPIVQAFEAMEEALCEDYLTPIGTPNEISQFVSTAALCPTKDTVTPCGGKYGDISGWIPNPVTSFEHMKNMALAICKLDECAKYAPTGICVALPPTNIQVAGLTVSGCYIKWTNPLSYVNPDLDDPVEIRFEFYHPSNLTTPIALAAGPNSGNSGSQTYMSFQPSLFNNNNNVVNSSILPGVEYIIRGYAFYTACGKSLAFAETKGILKQVNSTAEIRYKLENAVSTPKTCDALIDQSYLESKRTVRLELVNPADGSYVANGTSQKIVGTFKVYYTNPCNLDSDGDPIVEVETLVVKIPQSSAYGTNTFVESEKVPCTVAGIAICKDAGRVLKCLVDVKLENGSPIPAGISIHTSLSSLPVCP